MASWHMLIMIAALCVFPLNSDFLQRLSVEETSHCASVGSAGELSKAKAACRPQSVIDATGEDLSESAPKRQKLSSLLAWPHHDISKAFTKVGQPFAGVHPPTSSASKVAGHASYGKSPYDVGSDGFISIDHQIAQVMSMVQIGSTGPGTPPGQPVQSSGSLLSSSVYYRLLTGKTPLGLEETVKFDIKNPHLTSQLVAIPFNSGRQTRTSARRVERLKVIALGMSQPERYPQIQTLRNYLSYLLLKGKSPLESWPKKHALQYFIDWNVQRPLESPTRESEVRLYFDSYAANKRWPTLPPWRRGVPDALANLVHEVSVDLGLRTFKLLNIMSQLDESIAGNGHHESDCRNLWELCITSRRGELTKKALEKHITLSLTGFITILYAVFTPFDHKNILEMRRALLTLMNDLKIIFLHIRLGEGGEKVPQIANAKSFAVSKSLVSFFRSTTGLHHQAERASAKAFHWWFSQQGSNILLQDVSALNLGGWTGFLTFLKDCLFVNWLSYKDPLVGTELL